MSVEFGQTAFGLGLRPFGAISLPGGGSPVSNAVVGGLRVVDRGADAMADALRRLLGRCKGLFPKRGIGGQLITSLGHVRDARCRVFDERPTAFPQSLAELSGGFQPS